MARQVFPQWSPVVRAHNENQQEVYIPAAIIHAQTRDGKDELIVGAANMQKDDVTGLYLPTDKDFPLEARVRHLEALIGKLDASKETDPDAASATLLALLRGLLAGLNTVAGTVDNGAAKVTLTGHLPQPSSPIPVDIKGGGPATYKLIEQRTEADAVGDTLSFSGPIITVEIWNLDPYNVGVFVVNGVSITMPPQAHFFAQVGTVLGTDVTVSGSNQYIVGRYE